MWQEVYTGLMSVEMLILYIEVKKQEARKEKHIKTEKKGIER